MARMRWIGSLRVLHPFPSLLDGAVTVAIGLAAGGEPATALRLGLAMTLLQFAIGAANDLADRPFELDRPDKPLATGALPVTAASALGVGSAAAGLALAAPSGPVVLALALVGLGVGLGYDLRLKRTPWSWVALAVAFPILVAFAWYGATGVVDRRLVALLPAAALAGASLALGNALVDPDRDRAAGIRTPVVALGTDRAWRAAVLVQGGAVLVAIGSLAAADGRPAALVTGIGGGVVAFVGLGLVRGLRRERRERGWELQALGIALLGASWVAGIAGA